MQSGPGIENSHGRLAVVAPGGRFELLGRKCMFSKSLEIAVQSGSWPVFTSRFAVKTNEREKMLIHFFPHRSPRSFGPSAIGNESLYRPLNGKLELIVRFGKSGRVLQRQDVPLLFDLLQGNKFAMITTGTMFRRLPPCRGAGKIRIPEGPSPALARPRTIDLAGSALAVKENAVAVWEFDQAPANSNPPYIAFFKLLDLKFQQCCQRLDFLFVDPDIARCPRTTITALRALKPEAGMIPWSCRHCRLHNSHSHKALQIGGPRFELGTSSLPGNSMDR